MEIFTSEISIFKGKPSANSNELLYKGQILVKDNHAEGIMIDQDNNSYFIFGNFIKFGNIDLILPLNDTTLIFNGRKGLYTYNGMYTKHKNNQIIEEDSFYLKELGLNFDPREIDSENPNPIISFEEELEPFKQLWLSNPNNQMILEYYLNKNNTKRL